jgi:hypothetical protein
LADINDHIKQVNSKLQVLLKQFAALQNENLQLKNAHASLIEQNTIQKNTIETLKQEQLILKASIDKMDDLEKKELEKKINGFLKSIDKSIALLSHKHNAE